MMRLLILCGLTTLAAANAAVAEEAIDFVRDVRPILKRHCESCHGPEKQKSGLRLDIKAAAFQGGELYGPSILPRQAADSPLVKFIADPNADLRMPPKGDRLAEREIATLTRWVEMGAVWPDGIDSATLPDPRDHWAFQAVSLTDPPATNNEVWPRNDIDRFILARLERSGLVPAPETDRNSWLRRVTLDLIGLPPTPEQLERFLADPTESAYERAVDELLMSPRYGERWAQHWLDVVRYADTHGFEVNTERPHAWPYRDYVIDALNKDTPYDRFIREQLIGDAAGQDAATGFLVTASVLLPGQIGKDEPSIRLARQDALDEIVVNIGQTFFGLTIGCARCHDHKFDPISQKDYYAAQAFVAGVEYGDREIQTDETRARKKQAEVWQKEVAEIDRRLLEFVPIARTDDVAAHPTDPRRNEETFAPLLARFVRFTIHDANLHPALGLIEPCLDEFEIFTADDSPRNVALAALGTKVTASGSRTSASHRLEYVNDGQYGNSRSWMSDEKGRGWVLFELPEAVTINHVVWGRDREGKYSDRLATAYTLEAGPDPENMTTVAAVAPPRPPVNPRMNVDRFAPITTQRLRFTIEAANSLEPCLDELEVFTTAGENIALAGRGTTVRSSGEITVPNRHELRFVNDGEYGNSRSWMSHEMGRGWVELEFPKPVAIDRVVWGRDRLGEFQDRLPIAYRIEVAADEGGWRTVAAHQDRAPFDPELKSPLPFSTAGLSPEESTAAGKLLERKRQLERQIAEAVKANLVFAGTFRRPDEIHVLRRGDPEQPLERVAPAVPAVLGTMTLENDADERQRRQALAEWIASPANPLTARVMVNRLWQGHFGIGLVDTPNDFGRNGSQPSHPELLDWLAREFVRSGWSIKHLHKLIVLSATYRQSTDHNSAAAAVDADDRLLWRFPSRRLEGEAIRDSILAVSGKLNLKTGGPGYDLFDKRGGLTGFQPIEKFSDDGLRRMIYAHKVRRERDAVFGAFDCPDAGQSTPGRRESTTPIQALNLFNSPFVIEQSRAFAERVVHDVGSDPEAQVVRAYRLALCRSPEPVEIAEVLPVIKEHGLAVLCRVLFNCNEFLFIP